MATDGTAAAMPRYELLSFLDVTLKSDEAHFWEWMTELRQRYAGWQQRRGMLSPSVEKLVGRIREAFRKVRVGPEVMLYLSGAAEDDYLPESFQAVLRKKEERVLWKSILLDVLYACSDCLSYLDAEGTRFLLPAYMCYDLCYPEEEWNGLDFFLSSPRSGRFSLFDAEQRACVTDYVNEKRLQDFREEGVRGLSLHLWSFLLPWEEILRQKQRSAVSPKLFAEEQLLLYCEREGIDLC